MTKMPTKDTRDCGNATLLISFIKPEERKTLNINISGYVNNIIIELEIEKVDVFRKVLNKQFIERLRAIFIINKTQLQTPTDCFTPWGDHQGDLKLYFLLLSLRVGFPP